MSLCSKAKVYALSMILWMSLPRPAMAMSLTEFQSDPSRLMEASSEGIQGLIQEVRHESQMASGEKERAIRSLQNFSNIQKKLKICLASFDGSAQLHQAILSGGLMGACFTPSGGHSGLVTHVEELRGVSQAASYSDIRAWVAERALRNAGRTAHEYRSRFEGAARLEDPADAEGMKRMVGRFCPKCSDQQLNAFFEEYRVQYAHSNSQEIPKYGIQELVAAQNRVIEGLNDRIQAMIDAKNRNDEASAESTYQDYLIEYQRFASSPVGAVFLTESIKDRVGNILTPDDFKKKFWIAGKIEGRKHESLPAYGSCQGKKNCQEPAEKLIRKSLSEVESKVAEHTRKIMDAKSFEELLDRDPAMVGQVLIHYPELMDTVCDSAKNILKSRQKVAQILSGAESFINVLDAASLGLMLAGGSGVILKAGTTALRAGLGVASKSFIKNAGTAQGRTELAASASSASFLGTTSGQLLSRTVQLGVVSEAAHLLTDGSKSLVLAGHQDLILASRMARVRSDVDARHIAELEKNWNESMSHLMQGMAINSLPLLGGLMRVRASLGGSARGSESLTDSLREELRQDQKLLGLMQQFKPEVLNRSMRGLKAQALAVDDVAGGLAAISRMNEKVQILFHETVSKAGEIPSKYLRLMEKAGREGATCVLR